MNQNKLSILKDFIAFCKSELNIQTLPKVSLLNDKTFVEQFRSFGEYNPQTNSIKVVALNRNLADICRSLAHELCHHRQNELGLIYNDAGETGTDIENDANAMAGIIMRDYGRKNVAVYDLNPATSINEIGEGTKTYSWRFDDEDADGNRFYSFDTENSNYSVGIANLEDSMYDLSFNTTSPDGDPDTSLDTNEGVPLRVLSTVVDIAKDFINKADPEIVIFRPIKTKEANREDDQRRFKVYGAYLRKNLPSNYNLMTFGDTYRIVKK
jgi:hypothetical protein